MIEIDAIDELVARSKDHRELRRFHQFHRAHPEVMGFLCEEIQLRIDSGFEAFSHRSLWEYCRWQLEMERGPGDTFLMNDHAGILYSRAITILHPEFNGRAAFRTALADDIFGTRLEPMAGSRKGFARLQWADGTPLESGWRPSRPHVPTRRVRRKRHIHLGVR